jgi:ribosome maturation factor RimP
VTLEEKIEALVKPVIESMDIDFWGCEYLPAGKNTMLRIFIDQENGIGVDDCGRVSRQISAIMDVEDPISSVYTLEVSSPGMDRPLFTPEQFKLYEGEEVKIRAAVPVMGRKRFKGMMEAVSEKGIEVEVDGEIYEIDFDEIEKANVVPEI